MSMKVFVSLPGGTVELEVENESNISSVDADGLFTITDNVCGTRHIFSKYTMLQMSIHTTPKTRY